jgi:hypothetical protein
MSDEDHFYISGYVTNRIVATGLQTTYMNFTNVLCIVQKWQCGVQFLLTT